MMKPRGALAAGIMRVFRNGTQADDKSRERRNCRWAAGHCSPSPAGFRKLCPPCYPETACIHALVSPRGVQEACFRH